MTFLDDELSVITGPYEDLLSIDDVIDQELILFVTLNINKNTEPVRALGKMLLQNLQLVVGKRYESEEERIRVDRPILTWFWMSLRRSGTEISPRFCRPLVAPTPLFCSRCKACRSFFRLARDSRTTSPARQTRRLQCGRRTRRRPSSSSGRRPSTP